MEHSDTSATSADRSRRGLFVYLTVDECADYLAIDALARRRRVLGPDHPDTLRSANGLAADLRMLGEAGDRP